MVLTSSSSSSSCDSLNSFDDAPANVCRTVKFLCSHSGRILPRYPDGRLRYVGGETRVFLVDRSISFSDLKVKLKNLCGWESVNLRCRLPTDDLDALISITSDEDLANLIEEYDIARRDQRSPVKIRAFLHPSLNKTSKSDKPGVPPQIRVSQMMTRGAAYFQHPVMNTAVPHRNVVPMKYSVHLAKSGATSPFIPGVPCGCSPLLYQLRQSPTIPIPVEKQPLRTIIASSEHIWIMGIKTAGLEKNSNSIKFHKKIDLKLIIILITFPGRSLTDKAFKNHGPII